MNTAAPRDPQLGFNIGKVFNTGARAFVGVGPDKSPKKSGAALREYGQLLPFLACALYSTQNLTNYLIPIVSFWFRQICLFTLASILPALL